MRILPIIVVSTVVSLLAVLPSQAARAGTARVLITPAEPVWMAGYAARDRAAEGTYQDLYAKALALEDEQGNRVVIITTDLLGFSAQFIEGIASEISSSTGLHREALLFNASHTHSGPALTRVLEVAYRMSVEESEAVRKYTDGLARKLTALVPEALSRMQPVHLSYGTASAPFAVNRRVPTQNGYVIGANRSGPVDHRVPFLAVDTEPGQLLAILFGYSCHNTTLQGSNYYYHGDYAGVAQEWLEKRYEGSTALFLTGTAGDANPYPRGTRELAEEHGQTLGRAISEALTGPLKSLDGPIRSVFGTASLEFGPLPGQAEFERRLAGADPFQQAHARMFLTQLNEDGAIDNRYEYPIQVWHFGDELTLVALAGEVVVDYGIRIREELNADLVWVAAYSNDVSCYIPSRRILSEGGYEAEDSMIYYGRPSRFDVSVEERIMAKVLELAGKLKMKE